MNIVLFEPGPWPRSLDQADFRAIHLREILKLVPGDRFAAGETGGLVGSLEYLGPKSHTVELGNPEWTSAPAPLTRVRLLIGTPRPPTARRLIKDLTTLGAAELHFVATELGDKAYLQSTLWQGEYVKNLWEGAAQARTTLFPRVERHQGLKNALKILESSNEQRAFFDEGGAPWDTHGVHEHSGTGVLWLALGPERGWSPAERTLLTDQGWQAAGLGPRVLRTETACTLALGLAVLKGWA